LMTALIALGAYIRIPLPFTPVPVTMQTMFVMLAAAYLGRKYAVASVMAYIGLGAMGLPVFQGYGFGMAHILGVTGGYLLGFIATAYLAGYIFEKFGTKNLLTVLGIVFFGTMVIYIFGAAWLSILLKTSFKNSLYLGVIPFLPGEAMKMLAASAILLGTGSKVKSELF